MRFPCFRDWLYPGIVALLLAGCAEPPPLRIGFLAELSGRSADLGEAARNGVILATDQYRENGRADKRPLEIIVRDSGQTAESAAGAAQELVAGGVDLIIGPTSSAVVDNILPTVEKAGVVLLTPTASAVKFHGKDDMLFRINLTTRDNGRNYAEHYFAKGFKRVSVAANENNRSFAESWLSEFRAAFEALGGEIVSAPFFDSTSANYTPIVDAMLAPRPDALLFIANAVDTARLSQQARKVAPEIPLIAAEWAGTAQLIELGGRAVEGLMIVQNYNQDDTSERFQAFRSAYAKRFGKEPVFGSVLAHDAATAALDALSRRPGGMSVKEALIKLGPYEGLQQRIRFDENGDTTRVAYFMAIRDGRFVRAQ